MEYGQGRSVPGGLYGGASAQQAADMSAQKEALYRQTMNAVDAPTRNSEAAIQQITQRLHYLNDVAIRLEHLTNRACGCAPPSAQASNGKLAPSPDSLAGKLDLIAMGIEQINEHMATSLNRLESFV